MHELMFQAGVKGMSERSELIPCNYYIRINMVHTQMTIIPLCMHRGLVITQIQSLNASLTLFFIT